MKFVRFIILVAACFVLASCGDEALYRHCKQRSNLDVAYIENFRLEDGSAVSVTTVCAKDAAGWQWMQEEFGIVGCDDEEGDELQVWLSAPGHPARRIRPTDRQWDLVVVAPAELTVCAFHVRTEQQASLLMDRVFDRLDSE